MSRAEATASCVRPCLAVVEGPRSTRLGTPVQANGTGLEVAMGQTEAPQVTPAGEGQAREECPSLAMGVGLVAAAGRPSCHVAIPHPAASGEGQQERSDRRWQEHPPCQSLGWRNKAHSEGGRCMPARPAVKGATALQTAQRGKQGPRSPSTKGGYRVGMEVTETALDISGIRISPPELRFLDAVPGGRYRAHLRVQNLQPQSCFLHILPPQRPQFKLIVENPKKPVASGLHITATVDYHPDKEEDLRDRLLLYIEKKLIEIPLIGYIIS
uniref:Uncharacterized protein n=1 Tax=Sphaerodactylus townsendi TaxID=933632 RepID=A0ACB8FI45_9SAUR